MIKFYENLWVGNSSDAATAPVDAVLNVANDLRCQRGHPVVSYMQVGLIDGPGNSLSLYYAAVIALASLMRTGKRVLVQCHEGRSRSVAVAIMYLQTISPIGWSKWLDLAGEMSGNELPAPHYAHKEAFNKMNWELLKEVLK